MGTEMSSTEEHKTVVETDSKIFQRNQAKKHFNNYYNTVMARKKDIMVQKKSDLRCRKRMEAADLSNYSRGVEVKKP